MEDRHSDFRLAFMSTLPVMAGYLVLGIGFGFVMRSSGYGTVWSAAEALFIYAGAMQYAAVGLLRTHASLITVALTAFAVNARHIFYGISMLEPYGEVTRGKWYLIYSLTDETYSLLCDRNLTDSAKDTKRFFFMVSILDHIYWTTGCVLGGLLSSVVPFGSAGADFALTALFVSVFVGQWKSTSEHGPAIAGVICSAVSMLLFGKDSFLIPAMIMIIVVLLLMRRYGNDA